MKVSIKPFIIIPALAFTLGLSSCQIATDLLTADSTSVKPNDSSKSGDSSSEGKTSSKTSDPSNSTNSNSTNSSSELSTKDILSEAALETLANSTPLPTQTTTKPVATPVGDDPPGIQGDVKALGIDALPDNGSFEVEDEFWLEFNAPEEVAFLPVLSDGQNEIANYTSIKRSGSDAQIKVRFPKAGSYTFTLWVSVPSDGTFMRNISFKLNATGGAKSTFGEETIDLDFKTYYTKKPDIANCDPGELSPHEKLKALKLLNQIRKNHNLRPVVYDLAGDKEASRSALISVANNTLLHVPNESHKCFSEAGLEGGKTSNLWMGSYSSNLINSEASIIDLLVDGKGGTPNGEPGHRVWFLDPELYKVSFGRVDGQALVDDLPKLSSVSVKVIYSDNPPVPAEYSPEFVAYPYEDYPFRFFPSDDKGDVSFSFKINPNKDVDYSDFKVEVTTDSDSGPISVYSVPKGKSLALWRVKGLQKNVKYDVKISSIKVKGVSKDYSYWFRLK